MFSDEIGNADPVVAEYMSRRFARWSDIDIHFRGEFVAATLRADQAGFDLLEIHAAHGAAGLDISTGQVAKEEKPAFGGSYQTPFADRIRQEVAESAGVAVIAVGAISTHDDVNSVLLAGRADLVALGRTHLYDPQWTLHAAAEQEYQGPRCPVGSPVQGGSPQAAELPHRRRPPASFPPAGA